VLKFGILGAGFGIYGYLPAVHKLGYEILLLERYRETLNKRAELIEYVSHVNFYKKEEDLIAESDCLIFARTPQLQYHFILQNIDSILNKRHVFLEKPLTDNSEHSNKLFKLFTEYRLNFSIGYLFKYTKWFREISNVLSKSNVFQINWQIPLVDSGWKNSSFLGGGPIRFYGIHFFTLLFDLGIDASAIRVEANTSSFKIDTLGNPKFEIRGKLVETDPSFNVTELKTGDPLFSESTPLGRRPISGYSDPRIPIIVEYLENELSAPTPIEKTILFEKQIDEILNR